MSAPKLDKERAGAAFVTISALLALAYTLYFGEPPPIPDCTDEPQTLEGLVPVE